MFSYIIFVLATAVTSAFADESYPAIYPPPDPLVDGATAPDVVNIMYQPAGLLKDTEMLASIVGVVSQ